MKRKGDDINGAASKKAKVAAVIDGLDVKIESMLSSPILTAESLRSSGGSEGGGEQIMMQVAKNLWGKVVKQGTLKLYRGGEEVVSSSGVHEGDCVVMVLPISSLSPIPSFLHNREYTLDIAIQSEQQEAVEGSSVESARQVKTTLFNFTKAYLIPLIGDKDWKIKSVISNNMIKVNRKPCSNTHQVLQGGDTLSIKVVKNRNGVLVVPLAADQALKFDVKYDSDHVALLFKPNEIHTEDIAASVRHNIAPSKAVDALPLPIVITDLFYVLSGLVFIVKSESAWRQYTNPNGSVNEDFIVEEFSAVVAGLLDSELTIDTPKVDGEKAVTVVTPVAPSTRCKRAQWLTAVTINTVGKKQHRQLEIQLEAADHQILGCGTKAHTNMFPGKGRFMCLTKITFTPLGEEVPHAITYDVPDKFSKMMSRESAIWERDVRERAIEELGPSATEEMLQRAVNGEPVPYIKGFALFGDLRFNLTHAVMVPRSGSMALIDSAVHHMSALHASNAAAPIKVLDLGTGSGVLLLGLLNELKKRSIAARGVGIDISAPALEVAQSNVVALGFEDTASLVEASFSDLHVLDGEDRTRGPFDCIVCNPPYKANDASRGLDKGQRDYEPETALFAGPTGFECYRTIEGAISKNGASVVREGSVVILEIGPMMEDVVCKIFDKTRWEYLGVQMDCNNLKRCVVFKRIK